MLKAQALETLQSELGGRVRTDPDQLYPHSFDGMRLAFPYEADIVVEREEEVGTVLRLANQYDIPVTTRGAGSTLTGAAAPARGGWVLSTEKLGGIALDPINRTATVGPGVVLATLQEQVEAAGLFYPPDPSSRKYCTLGGNLACNAGGMRCVKYGVTGDYVLSLRGYLPTGEYVEWGRPLRKYVVGYDLRSLWVGSEGTLGVITGATLRLLPRPERQWNLLLAYPTEAAALAAVLDGLEGGLRPAILEFLDIPSVTGAERAAGRPIFADCPGHSLLLLQLDGSAREVEEQRALALAWAERGASAYREAASPTEAEELWNIRRACSSAMFELGDSKLNEDVVVPLDRQVDLLHHVEDLRQRHRVNIAVFGHAGDGNLHVNFMHHAADPAECQRAREALGELMRTVVDLGGAISGEHGIGLAKSPFLSLQLRSAESGAMRAVKQALDPRGILNPGKIFEPFEVWDKPKESYRFPWDHA